MEEKENYKKVVVGIIVRKDALPLYLLVSSKRDFGEYTGFYYPPAGHVEQNEDEEMALKREICEELGVDIVSAEKIAETKGDVKDQKTSWYLCDVDSYDFKINKEELADAGFFTQQEIRSMKIWPATLKVLEEYVFSNR